MKTKKNWAMFGASLAVILTGLLVGLAACQTGMDESLSLSWELPNGSVVENTNGTHSFALTWTRDPGVLPITSIEGETGNVNPKAVEAMLTALEEWRMYTRIIDPRPFYDKVGDGKAPEKPGPEGGEIGSNPFAVGIVVGGGFKLDNSNPAHDGNIVIHRYWPMSTTATGTQYTPNRDDWRKTDGDRAKAFKAAVKEIEGMLAAIEASPYYKMETFNVMGDDGVVTEVDNPLKSLYRDMDEVISHDPPLEDCGQRVGIDWSEESDGIIAQLIPGRSGTLYEYYLGDAPGPSYYKIETGPFALPEN